MTRIALVVCAALLAGCGGAETTAAARDPERPAATADGRAAKADRDCTLITAAEMSSFVGTPVTAEAEEGGGTATCRYASPSSSVPSIEVKVEWGSGEVAMAATGVFGRLETGIADALDGVGDQAAAIGPAVMVRTGADLITLTPYGVDDRPALIRRIVQAMRPRMGPSSQPTSASTSGSSAVASNDAKAAAGWPVNCWAR